MRAKKGFALLEILITLGLLALIGAVVYFAITQRNTSNQSGARNTPTPSVVEGKATISGKTVVDGGCPVVQENSPCPEVPIEAKITITKTGSDSVIKTISTDSKGKFTIALDKGEYSFRAVNTTGSMLPTATPLTVSVPDGKAQTITITFDSGIR